MAKQWVGQEQKIKVGDKEYTLAREDGTLRNAFGAWATKQLKNPIDAIKDQLRGLDPQTAALFAKEALKQSRLSYDFLSPEVQSVLQSELGLKKWLSILLEPHHPNVTEGEVDDVFQAIAESEAAKQNSFRDDTGKEPGKLSLYAPPSSENVLREEGSVEG